MTRPRQILISAAAMLVAIGIVAATVLVTPASSATSPQLSWGATLVCTADSSGYCTAGHPAGVIPDSVTVTPELPAIVSVDRKTTVNFRVRFVRAIASGGSVTPLMGTRVFNVHMDWTLGSPAPSSTSLEPSPSASGDQTWPDAMNTGVPAGTALDVITGNQTVNTANTVIDAKDIRGCVDVRAPGVTIKRSKISCDSFAAVSSFDGVYAGDRLTIQDSEIDCQNGGGRTAVGDTYITAVRVNIHGCENGLDIDQHVTVQDSYIHDLANGATTHTDGIQLAHYLDNGSEVPHARDVAIIHNTIYGTSAQTGAGTSAIISNPSGDTDVLVQNNLLAGGAYTLYCPYQGTGVNYRVIGNHFSRQFSTNSGAFGPWTGCEDEAQVTGNVWHDTGMPL